MQASLQGGRKSAQGIKTAKPGKPPMIHVSLSLRDDVKLHETENAWKPQMMKNEPELSEEEKKTQVIKPSGGLGEQGTKHNTLTEPASPSLSLRTIAVKRNGTIIKLPFQTLVTIQLSEILPRILM